MVEPCTRERRGGVTVAVEGIETIRKEVAERGVEFIFAQFVDMHARPSAKLIPAAYLDDLVADGAGFRGLRRRRHRPGAQRPRHRGHPRPVELHPRPVGLHGRAVRVRRHGRGRAVAVRPPDDPPPHARADARGRLRVQDRPRARVLPPPPRRGRPDRARRPVRRLSRSPATTSGASRATTSS